MRRKTYENELNFITLTVVAWIDIFTRRVYNDFLMDSLQHCHKEKGLEIFAYVLMTNHLHLIVRSKSQKLSGILRDFKTYTSKELIKLITYNKKESRKKWMLEKFREYGYNNPYNKKFQLWKNGSYPVVLFSRKVINQKIRYIHMNPVKAGFVDEPQKYYYSSANPSNPLRIELDSL